MDILGSCYCKKQIDVSFFYVSVLLLMINCVITLSKFTAWFHSHFDNVVTQFIVNRRTDA